MGLCRYGAHNCCLFARPIPIVEVAAEADAMVTVFGILNLTEDSFFDESRRLDPAGAVTAAIEMLRVGSDVVDVGPAASHPDARPVSPADEIRRIAPLLDALSDQMHRVSIDSFQPETQRYALKRGVGYLNDIQGFPDPALYPDIAEADCRLVVMHSAQRDGIATRTGHLRPEDALDEIVRFFEARVSALRRSGVAADRLILDPGLGFFLSPAPETSLHVLSNLQKLKSALGLPLLVSVSRKSFLGATVGLPVKDLGPASLAAELHAIGNGADYVRTHAPGDLRSAITFSETLAKFRSRDARDRGLDHA
uniref:Dihydropteroate synthase n=3 Tax=Enterobacteriaceae TaxID=543 RepID=C1IUN6_ENTCL|nr:Sul1 [Enterobacter cloacae]ACO54337.1 Sul1 [Enterobacter cloacae]